MAKIEFDSRIHVLGVSCPECNGVVIRKSDGACLSCIGDVYDFLDAVIANPDILEELPWEKGGSNGRESKPV